MLRRAAALLAVVVAAVACCVLPAWAAGTYTSSILATVNGSRAAHGLQGYALRSDLSSVALSWSQHMASTGVLSHNPRLTAQVSGWRAVGENVGYAATWSAVMDAFTASPEHRANILDRDFTQIGVGTVVSSDRIWVTQVFRQPRYATARSSTSKLPQRQTRPGPTPAQLLADRIRQAAARQIGRPTDPVDAGFRYVMTMRAVAHQS